MNAARVLNQTVKTLMDLSGMVEKGDSPVQVNILSDSVREIDGPIHAANFKLIDEKTN